MAHRVLIRFPGSSTFEDYSNYVFLPDQTGGQGQSVVGGGSSQSTQQATIIKKWEVNTPPIVTFFVGGTLQDVETPVFVPPVTGCLVWVDSDHFPAFFTGYITNEPEVVPIGADAGTVDPAADDPTQRYYGYVCQCTGEEIVLDMNLIGFIQPFVNLTVGGIIAALGELLLPGRFDWTNVDGFGPVIPVFAVQPQSIFSKVVGDLIANMACKLWYKRGVAYIAHYDENNPAIEPTVSENDPGELLYNPHDLVIKPIPNAIINDVTGIGDTEAQTYCREYTLGDGVTTNYPLKLPIFGTLGVPIVEDDFSAGGTGSTGTGDGVTNLSNQIWAPFGIEPGDSSDPSNAFQLSGSSLNVIGGLGLGNTMLLMAQGVEIKGVLEVDAGEFQFVDASDAIVGALCTTETGLLASVKYGWRFTKHTAGGTGHINEHPEGTVNGTNVDFFLSQNPIISSLVLTVNGTPQTYGADFTVSVNAITFVTPPPIGATIVADYNYEIGPQTNIQAIVDGALVGTQITTKPGFTYSMRLQVSTPVQKTTLPPWYSSGSQFGGGSKTAPVTASFLIEEYSQLAVKDPNKYTVFSITQTGVPAFLFVCELSVEDANFAVNYFQVTTPIQGRLFTRLVSDADPKQRKLGYVGDPDADATVTATNESMTLSFFQQTRPVLRQRNEFRYRSAGPAVARVIDTPSIILEAERYGDSGHRKALLTNLNPLPATSEELEWALQAYLDDNDHQQFEGSWMAMTPPYTWSEEPIPGRFINIQCPSRTPEQVTTVGSPPVTGFSELIKVVTITCTAESDDGTLEQFEVLFEYGLVVTKQMQKVLLKFAIPDPPQVAVLRQISNVPAVDTSLIGTNFIEDAPVMAFYDRDFQNYYIDIGQNLLAGEQVEVRYSDASWGNPGGANLIGRFGTRTFSLKRKQRDFTFYAKLVRPAGSPGTYVTSRYPAMNRIEYPLIPPQPSGFEVNAGNFQVPSIHFDLPPDTRDIFGILIQDKRTLINSQVTLASNMVGDVRDMLVAGQDPNGNYIEETLTLNGTTPVTTTKTFAWILWVNSFFGTVLNEIPTPPTDGTTTAFTVRDNPVPGTVQVYVDAVAQVLGVDYTTTGNVITFVNPPVAGSEIFISYIFELVPTATVTISAGGTIGVLAPGALQWLSNPILYRYEDLSFGGSNNDPALTFNFQNTLQETTHNFFVYFYNRLDELSLPYNPAANFLQPNQAGGGAGGGGQLFECLDVRTCGAIGDGITDDTEAVQSCLDKAASNYKALVALGFGNPNVTLIGSPAEFSFSGGEHPPVGSPGLIGPTIVCIPSGVYCRVFPRKPDFSQQCFGGSNLFALSIDDGVTLQVDGGLILGIDIDVIRALDTNHADSLVILENRFAFDGGIAHITDENEGTGDGVTTDNFFTSFGPTIAGTMTITVGGVPVTDFTIGSQSVFGDQIIFATPPGNGLTILASYDYTIITTAAGGNFPDLQTAYGIEAGPRNTNIRITGDGFIDAGGAANSFEMLTALTANLDGTAGTTAIFFMKCDQSVIDTVTFQDNFLQCLVYWGHSEQVQIHNCTFQHSYGGGKQTGRGSGIEDDFQLNMVGIVADVLRQTQIYSNTAIDIDGYIEEFACSHIHIHDNAAHLCGMPCYGIHFFMDSTFFYCITFTAPIDSDGNRDQNHYTNNRGLVWRPNQYYFSDNLTVAPSSYVPGDHIWAPVDKFGQITDFGGTPWILAPGISGPTEPDWAHPDGMTGGGSPAPYKLDAMVPVKNAFLGFWQHRGANPTVWANPGGFYLPFSDANLGVGVVVYKNGVPLVHGVDWTSGGNGSGYGANAFPAQLIQFTPGFTAVDTDVFTCDLVSQVAWVDQGTAYINYPLLPSAIQLIGSTSGFTCAGLRLIGNEVSDNGLDGIGYLGLDSPQIANSQVLRNYGAGIIDLSLAPESVGPTGSITPEVVNNRSALNGGPNFNVNTGGGTFNNPQGGAGGGGGGGTATSEVPTGTINGVNTVFHTAHNPIGGSLVVFRDGLRTTAFTLTGGNVITFSVAPTTSVIIDYKY